MVTEKAVSVISFIGFTEGLSKKKLLTPDEAENAKSQYESFIGYESQISKK